MDDMQELKKHIKKLEKELEEIKALVKNNYLLYVDAECSIAELDKRIKEIDLQPAN